jgi:Malectin domain
MIQHRHLPSSLSVEIGKVDKLWTWPLVKSVTTGFSTHSTGKNYSDHQNMSHWIPVYAINCGSNIFVVDSKGVRYQNDTSKYLKSFYRHDVIVNVPAQDQQIYQTHAWMFPYDTDGKQVYKIPVFQNGDYRLSVMIYNHCGSLNGVERSAQGGERFISVPQGRQECGACREDRIQNSWIWVWMEWTSIKNRGQWLCSWV